MRNLGLGGFRRLALRAEYGRKGYYYCIQSILWFVYRFHLKRGYY